MLRPGGERVIQDGLADGDHGDSYALTRDIDKVYDTFLDTMQNTVRLWERLGFTEIVVVDLHEKLGDDFVKPFRGYPFLSTFLLGRSTPVRTARRSRSTSPSG